MANLKSFVGNYIALFMLLGLTADALVANWNLNPIWDVFYARIQLNLFYNSHAMSILPFCAAGFWMAYKRDSIITATFAAFGTASIHELTLDAADLGFFRIPSGISWSYALVMFAILIIGWTKGRAYHRNVWLTISLVMALWFFILGGLNYTGIYHIGSTISAAVDFAPSKDFMNPVTNFFEVVSWLVPSALWFLPRKWFDWKRLPQ